MTVRTPTVSVMMGICTGVAGGLTRKVYAEVPPRVEYTLTELGRSLRPVLASMAEWGSKYQRENR